MGWFTVRWDGFFGERHPLKHGKKIKSVQEIKVIHSVKAIKEIKGVQASTLNLVLRLRRLVILCILMLGTVTLNVTAANADVTPSPSPSPSFASDLSAQTLTANTLRLSESDLIAKAGVPPALAPWVPWVLADVPEINCPESGTLDNTRQCQWPAPLHLQLLSTTEQGVILGFRQQWRVYAPGWLTLPGGDLPQGETNWPTAVLLNAAPAVVIRHANRPAIWVPAGDYTVSGELLIRRKQAYFWIPAQTGLVHWDQSTLANRAVLPGLPNFPKTFRHVFSKPPRVDAQGRLWLTPPQAKASQQENALNYSLFRRFKDGVPVVVTSRLNLSVGGQAREVRLPNMLLPDMTLIATDTTLPYRWDGADLLIRVKPGQWPVQFRARYSEPVRQVTVPKRLAPSEQRAQTTIDVVQPAQTLWVLAVNRKYRALNTDGLLAIDPMQTALPETWRGDSAFLAEPGAVWTWSASSLPTRVGKNDLRLQRDIWLDFETDGMTVQDKIEGKLGDQWRLSTRPPLNLGRVMVNDRPAVITVLSPQGVAEASPESGTDMSTQAHGIELRSSAVALEATGRFADRAAALPVTGWEAHFSDVRWQLHLPPAWAVLAVQGADHITGTWWSHWRIWDVFWVALLVAAIYRLSNAAFAGVTGLLLVLTYDADFSLSPVMWAITIIVLALSRSGIQAAWVRRITTTSAVLVSVLWVVLLAPMLFGELKRFVFPEVYDDIRWTVEKQAERGAPGQPVSHPAPPPPQRIAPQVEAFRDQGREPLADDFALLNQASALKLSSGTRGFSALQSQDAGKGSARGPQKFQYNRQNQVAPAGVQTGPGAPNWQRRDAVVKLHWKGPVSAAQQVRVVWAPPILLRGLSALKLLLWPVVFLGFIYWLWQSNPLIKSLLKGVPIPALLKRLPAATASSVLLWSASLSGALFLMANTSNTAWAATQVAPSQSAQMQAFPDENLLSALQARVSQAPACAPNCFALEAVKVHMGEDQLTLDLNLHVQTPLFLAMPVAAPHWMPNRITVNGQEAYALTFSQAAPSLRKQLTRPAAQGGEHAMGQQHILLSAGHHRVRLWGQVIATREVQLAFPWSVQNLEVASPHWTVQGLKGQGLINNTLILKRKKQAKTAAAQTHWLPQPAPEFVRLHRHFTFDHELLVVNTVRRIAPKRAAIALNIPLRAGETVLDEQLKVSDKGVAVNLAAGQKHFTWRSQISLSSLKGAAPSDAQSTQTEEDGGVAFSPELAINLQALAEPNIAETWRFSIAEQWHLNFRGLTALPLSASADRGGRWQPTFWPWAGESLQIVGIKPAAVPGHNLTVAQAAYQLDPGLRATEAQLTLTVSNSVASPLKVGLPAQAYDVSLKINGRVMPVPETLIGESRDGANGVSGEPTSARTQKWLEPLLQPGEHSVLINFQLPEGVAAHYRVPEIVLPRPLVNLETRVNLSRDRWVLWLAGEGYGPRVTFWVAFALVLLAAPWISQKKWIPVSGVEWILLGLGFSVSFWPGLVGLLLWLIVLKAKPMWAMFIRKPRVYNGVQMALIMLSVWVLISFIVAVPTSLLAHPRMAVTGQYWSGAFVWYQDRLGADFPGATILSLPLWVYRVAMLVWCLWLANRMVQWARWGWAQLALMGWFKPLPKKQKNKPQAEVKIDNGSAPNAAGRDEASGDGESGNKASDDKASDDAP